MTTQASFDTLCKLFTDIFDTEEDANLATLAVRQTKNLKSAINVLRKEKLKLFQSPSAGSILNVMDTIVDITKGNIELLCAI